MSLNSDEKLGLEEEIMEPAKDIWAEYVCRGNPMKVNAEGVSKRLNELSAKLFSKPEKMQIDILDVASKFALQGCRGELTCMSPF
jgi:hypothetical protein